METFIARQAPAVMKVVLRIKNTAMCSDYDAFLKAVFEETQQGSRDMEIRMANDTRLEIEVSVDTDTSSVATVDKDVGPSHTGAIAAEYDSNPSNVPFDCDPSNIDIMHITPPHTSYVSPSLWTGGTRSQQIQQIQHIQTDTFPKSHVPLDFDTSACTDTRWQQSQRSYRFLLDYLTASHTDNFTAFQALHSDDERSYFPSSCYPSPSFFNKQFSTSVCDMNSMYAYYA